MTTTSRSIPPFILVVSLVASLCAMLPSDVGAQPRDRDDYLLLIQEKGKVKGTMNGNVGVNEAGGSLKIGRPSTFSPGTVAVSDRLFLRGNPEVGGTDVFANLLKYDPSKAFPASVTQPVPAPVYLTEPLVNNPDPFDPGSFPPAFPITCGGPSKFGDINEVFTLTPGSYGVVRINRGGGATLPGGTYNICDLKVDKNADLFFTGPVTLNIRDRFLVKNGAAVLPLGNLSANDIVINVEATKGVRINQAATFSAQLFAPNTLLRLGRRAFATGRFVVKELRSDRGFQVFFAVPPPICGNGTLDPQETCDPPGAPQPPNQNICRTDCTFCGDNLVQPGEECDDGNANNTDACRNDCTLAPPPLCGNGQLDGAESCDPPGSAQPPNNNICRFNCTYCGDGVVDTNEQCDDGNSDNGDGCRNDCTVEPPPTCGDGTVDPGETCDPPGTAQPPNNNLCRVDCTYCGDGAVNQGTEECDDGNADNTDGCRNDCTLPPPVPCGNSTLDPGETCDPPGSDPPPPGGNLCRVNCTYCGDGLVQAGEQCDDANTNDTDACRNNCTLNQPPTCGNGGLDPGETCDPPGSDPPPPGGNLCRTTCTYCGDGVVNDNEQCDDGNTIDGDGCKNNCTLGPPPPVCGDGSVNQPQETCDPPGSDPPPAGGNLCRSNCTYCGDGKVDGGNGEQCDDGNSVDGDLCKNDCTLPPPPPCGLEVTKTCLVQQPPASGGNDCQGGVVSMTLRYTGDDCSATTNTQSGKATCSGDPAGAEPVRVVITKDASDASVTPSAETVGVGDDVVIAATGGSLKSNTEFDVRQGGGTLQSLNIHTSCSKPLNVGDQFGSMLLVELTTKDGGTVTLPDPPTPATSCEAPTVPPPPHCQGKVEVLSLRYIGGDCTITPNNQEGKATCSGNAGTAEPVRIVITRDEDKVSADPSTETVGLGDVFTITHVDGKLRSDTEFAIVQGGGVLQSLKIHTSCSKPLNVGNRFGGVEVVGIDPTEGGLAQEGATVDYEYTITNNGPGDVTNVSVVDDQLGTVPGSPIALLADGATVVLATSAFLEDDVTNLVTASGQHTGGPCEAMAGATVTFVDPPTPPAACESGKKVSAITLRYTGEGCSAGNNPQEGKATCTGGASFTQPVRILIRDDDNGSTIYGDEAGIPLGGETIGTAANANRSDFRSQTMVRIFNSGGALVEENSFHTSCSKPLAVGDKFGSLEVVGLQLIDK